MACVYVLVSKKDGKKYIGSTIDLNRRLKEHELGRVFSTKNRRPLMLYCAINYSTIEEAAIWEKKLKRSHDLLIRLINKGMTKILMVELASYGV